MKDADFLRQEASPVPAPSRAVRGELGEVLGSLPAPPRAGLGARHSSRPLRQGCFSAAVTRDLGDFSLQ